MWQGFSCCAKTKAPQGLTIERLHLVFFFLPWRSPCWRGSMWLVHDEVFWSMSVCPSFFLHESTVRSVVVVGGCEVSIRMLCQLNNSDSDSRKRGSLDRDSLMKGTTKIKKWVWRLRLDYDFKRWQGRRSIIPHSVSCTYTQALERPTTSVTLLS